MIIIILFIIIIIYIAKRIKFSNNVIELKIWKHIFKKQLKTKLILIII